jgi:acyl carrier protein
MMNARLVREVAAARLIAGSEKRVTVEKLREQLLDVGEEGVWPEQIHRWASERGYRASVGAAGEWGELLEVRLRDRRLRAEEAQEVEAAAEPEGREAAEPEGREAAEPEGREAAEPEGREAAEPAEREEDWGQYATDPLLRSLKQQLSVQLRSELQESLPAYMVPSVLVVLDELPLTANGKVDRRGLPEPEQRPEVGEYVAPRTPMEEAVAQIWAEVLKLQRVGVHDNFFELGGHSLLATRAVARTRDVLAVDVPLRVLFERPTVEQVVQFIVSDTMSMGELDSIDDLIRT